MSSKTISAHTQNPSIDGTEEIVNEKGGANYKDNYADFKNYITGSGADGMTVDTRHKKVTLTAANIKTGQSVPVTVIDAPGAGMAIKIIGCIAKFNWGSVAFENADLLLQAVGGQVQQAELVNFLPATANKVTFFTFYTTPGNRNTVLDDAAIVATTDADSVNGDSTIDLYISYQIITF